MKVAFRVDASLEIGGGHMMRCLTLANQLRNRGAQCRFFSYDLGGGFLDRVSHEGFEVNILNANDLKISKTVRNLEYLFSDDGETDAWKTVSFLNGWQPEWLVVDHYLISKKWETILRAYCNRIMVIDDLANREHQCDLLLDQNLVANYLVRYNLLIPKECRRLLGVEYALLQPQYASLHANAKSRTTPVRRILIFFGGADNLNLTGRAITAFLLLNREDIFVDVVLSASHPFLEKIKHQIRDFSNISLHQNLHSLAELILEADLCIGGGGATSWERCCLGLPSLVIVMAENQAEIAAEMNRQGYIRLVGYQDLVNEFLIKDLLNEALNFTEFSSWSEKCLRLLDGKGSQRVAELMLLNQNTNLKLRPASIDDENFLLGLANDPMVRQNSFNIAVIDSAAHHAWFHKRINSFDWCKIYICEVEPQVPIGMVRLERYGNVWEIHYSLDALARKKKLAQRMLNLAISLFSRNHLNDKLIARVKFENKQSQIIFKNLGFLEKQLETEFIYISEV